MALPELLRREYWRLEIPESLAAESRSRRDWNHFLDRHYRRKWNVRVSKVMDNATHVAMYFGFYLKKPPLAMSRLEHYAGRDDITFRYRSHRSGKEERLVMSGDEFMERFSWHVPEKRFRMVRYWGSTPEPPKFPACDFLVIFRNLNESINNALGQSFHPFRKAKISRILQTDVVHLHL